MIPTFLWLLSCLFSSKKVPSEIHGTNRVCTTNIARDFFLTIIYMKLIMKTPVISNMNNLSINAFLESKIKYLLNAVTKQAYIWQCWAIPMCTKDLEWRHRGRGGNGLIELVKNNVNGMGTVQILYFLTLSEFSEFSFGTIEIYGLKTKTRKPRKPR